MRKTTVLIWLCLIAVLGGCQSIRIHTGPPTDDEATAESSDRGRQIRAEWADRLRAATVPRQAALLKGFVDSTCARNIRYGYRIADMWRDADDQSGGEAPISEIRRVVDESTRSDLPVFEAYEDVLEYGINGIRDARFFEQRTVDMLLTYRDHYHEVYSAVFLPNGTRLEFEDRLRMLELRLKDLSLELEDELRR